MLARYKAMHETLVYLAHLDHDDTESQMLERLRLQVGSSYAGSVGAGRWCVGPVACGGGWVVVLWYRCVNRL